MNPEEKDERIRQLTAIAERFEKALIEIKNLDYRGNPHISSVIAKRALDEVYS